MIGYLSVDGRGKKINSFLEDYIGWATWVDLLGRAFFIFAEK